MTTGPLVAFFDRSDADHEWAKEQWSKAPLPMLTCEAVLAEAAYLLQERAGLAPEKLLALFERGIISVPFRLDEHAALVARLLERYGDQRMRLDFEECVAYPRRRQSSLLALMQALNP